MNRMLPYRSKSDRVSHRAMLAQTVDMTAVPLPVVPYSFERRVECMPLKPTPPQIYNPHDACKWSVYGPTWIQQPVNPVKPVEQKPHGKSTCSSFEARDVEFPADLEASEVPFSVPLEVQVAPVKGGRVKVTPNLISRDEVRYVDMRHPMQRARGYVSEAGWRDMSGTKEVVHYNDLLPSGTSEISDSDPEFEYRKEKVHVVMTGVAGKLEAVLPSENVKQQSREDGGEFHRGRMTRSGTEFGGAPIVKTEKTPPAAVFDPNDTSQGIPQPQTAAGHMPVRPLRVKRVATFKTAEKKD